MLLVVQYSTVKTVPTLTGIGVPVDLNHGLLSNRIRHNMERSVGFYNVLMTR